MKIVECPRDAMQGLETFVPTQSKIDYLNQLLKVGFDTLDFGSYVSPKAVPQMADTAEVLDKLDIENSTTKLLAIIANLRGAENALSSKIYYWGFPFSISETFQKRNTNKSILESLDQVKEIQNLAIKNNKKLVIYISMGFGNPYGDTYHTDIALEWMLKLKELEISHFSLADTLGLAKKEDIKTLFEESFKNFEGCEIGAHFHSTPFAWSTKIETAFEAGCRRFDSSIKGYGGCPLSGEELVGNIDTLNMKLFADEKKINLNWDKTQWEKAIQMAEKIFH